MSLFETYKIIDELSETIKSSHGNVAKIVQNKLSDLLLKNKGFQSICDIAKILNGEEIERNESINKLSIQEIACFKFAPVTSCDVERIFSRYKSILTDKRQSFTFNNLKMTFITNCN